jgi:hypothetical protein
MAIIAMRQRPLGKPPAGLDTLLNTHETLFSNPYTDKGLITASFLKHTSIFVLVSYWLKDS